LLSARQASPGRVARNEEADEEARIQALQGLPDARQVPCGWPVSHEGQVMAKDPRLSRVGVSGYNKPKRTPSHPTKSHVVVAKEGDTVKTIRFGQQGVKGSPEGTARNKSFKARHADNIAKGKMSAAYWANKVKW
jgi:hypothetical protein